MKTYIVVREEYEREGHTPLEVSLHKAKNLLELVKKLEPCFFEEGTYDPVQEFIEENGDGMDGYIIKELLPNNTLSEDLVAWYPMVEGSNS